MTQLESREFEVLFNIALYKEISFLDWRSGVALITEPAGDLYRVSKEAIDHLLKIPSGHAYYTRLLCHSLFNRMGKQDGKAMAAGDSRPAPPSP
jgi:hypothetical protein